MSASLGLTRLVAMAAMVAIPGCSDDSKSGNAPAEAGIGGGHGGKPTGGNAGTDEMPTGGMDGGGTNSRGGRAGMAGTGGAGVGGAMPDAGDGGALPISLCAGQTGDDQIVCGQYIVQSIGACGDCHTPLRAGKPDKTMLYAGRPSFVDIDAAEGVGNIPAPNLTRLKVSGWTAADVMTAVLDGRAKGGKRLFPAMPYMTFHNMARADAEAIAAFILQLDPIESEIPDREPLPAPIENSLPAKPVDIGAIPNSVLAPGSPSYDQAQLGKYLAGEIGLCLDCHTKRLSSGALDMSKAFAGGETFEPGNVFGTVYSANITPAANTGLRNWTPKLVRDVIKTGKTDSGGGICPPMPVGPNGSYAGMTEAHSLAIGVYITTLAPIENGTDSGAFPMCVPPPTAPGDAGLDASRSKDSGAD